MKKYISEFIGTFILVLIGCGTAMVVGTDYTEGCAYLAVALAFGFALVAAAYSIGSVSGCHINPAVSVASFINGGLNVTELISYIVSQIAGAFAAVAFLKNITELTGFADATFGFGRNSVISMGQSDLAGVLLEAVLTFIFVLVVLNASAKAGKLAGLINGLALTAVHIIGIPFTGTSVNPARSIAPAVMSGIEGDLDALPELWIFIVGPLLGAVIAAFVYKFVIAEKNVQ